MERRKKRRKGTNEEERTEGGKEGQKVVGK